MKIPAIILNTLILISFISCSLDLEKLSEEDVNQEQLDHAEQFANEYLITLKKGSTYEFRDEAIDALKNKLTPEKQKAVHSQLKENLGNRHNAHCTIMDLVTILQT